MLCVKCQALECKEVNVRGRNFILSFRCIMCDLVKPNPGLAKKVALFSFIIKSTLYYTVQFIPVYLDLKSLYHTTRCRS